MPEAVVTSLPEGGLYVVVETPQGSAYLYTAGEMSAAYAVAQFFDAVDAEVTNGEVEHTEGVVHS